MQTAPAGQPKQPNRTATPLPPRISRCVLRPEVFNWVL
ncbi:hypothetical protein SLEP1_g40717 [Rubroshorea leprosula]|uniref:Uncharacterized protein n=1 Tax=Rubroshorea leprosula TaxID=152421 RepID=A0AAV5L4A2_9ROSI|nr:hypothetical protein SLEP1_g40717 [Rubroshorea leprosula]